jgi:hemoglobin
MELTDIYSLIGEEGFARLVSAFYRQVPEDELLRPLYPPEDRVGAEQRLRDFLVYRFGGPPRYIHERGHPRLRRRHMPFRIDQVARDRWMQLMNNALSQTALPIQVERILRGFFEQTSLMMINHAGWAAYWPGER